jgi:glucokinase
MKIFAADIGGTNSRFAHFEVTPEGAPALVNSQWLRTRESSSFGNLLDLLSEKGFSLRPGDADICVIAVAGPVERGVYSSPPFISWDIDLSNAGVDFGFRRWSLINDFVAQAYACRSPIGESAEKILDGEVVVDAAVAVVGAGTALGKAGLIPDGRGGYMAVPSEGGHANFPFVSEEEYEFEDFLMDELGDEYVIANYVVSGKGLSLMHRYLEGESLEPQKVVARFSPASKTLDWAARFYGRVCRNYALEILALGGVYVAGGVASRAPSLLTHESFEREFRSSGTMGELLQRIPVYLISNEESGLWGAALNGLLQLRREGAA